MVGEDRRSRGDDGPERETERLGEARVEQGLANGADAGAFGDDGLQRLGLGGRLEQELAANREADAADTVGSTSGRLWR